ncbi:MAG: serine/threonine-protein kinase PknK [Polyangiaceae bacterium]
MIEFELPPRFSIVRRIGEGGMGVVYEAFDRERDTAVAIKVLHRTSADALLLFKREFRAVQDLNHPNLVGLGDLVSSGAHWFFTMELVRGVEFLRWVRPSTTEAPPRPRPEGDASSGKISIASSKTGYSEARLRAALAQLTVGLAALHDANLIHRDIKPSNVLVDETGRVVICDFGLVTALYDARASATTDIGGVVGTPAYMAPEQGASKPLTPAADWYAVGVLLYEALTGRVPFEGPPLQILLRKQTEKPPAPRDIAPRTPIDLNDLCTQLLHFDPERRPSRRAILSAFSVTPSASAAPSLHSHTQGGAFIGRQAELQALRVAFADARRGRPVTVLVHGESGIGKSFLVRHFADELLLHERDAVVLNSRCYERESVPYKAFDGIFDSLSRVLSRMPPGEARAFLPLRVGPMVQLFPVLRRVEAIAQAQTPTQEVADPQELRSRAFAAIRETFTRMADRRPLMLIIDDLQWADADSIALLAEVIRRPDAPAVFLVATLRDASFIGSPIAQAAATLAERLTGDVRHVELTSLPDDDARELARLIVARNAPDSSVNVDMIAKEAGGHPLFIDEIVRHTLLVGTSARLRLESALWSRIQQLDPLPRKIVELVSVAGAPRSQEIVAKALDAAPDDFARAASFLRVAHLVRTTGSRGSDPMEAYHGRVRNAVLEQLSPDVVRAHHRRLALAFETSGSTDTDSMAAHWDGSGDADNAAKHVLRAADNAMTTLAFDRAAKLYERALALRLESTMRVDRTAERDIEKRWGEALAMAGRGAESAKVYREAAGGANAAEALDLRRRAAEQLLRSGHFDEGLAAVRTILDEVGLHYPSTPFRAVLAYILLGLYIAIRGTGFRERDPSRVPEHELRRIDICWSIAFSLGLVDTIRGAYFQQMTLILALRAGDLRHVALVAAVMVTSSSFAGERAHRRTAARRERAMELAARSGEPFVKAWAHAGDGISRYLGGRFREALEPLAKAESLFRDECVGTAWEVSSMRLFTLQTLVYLGELKRLHDQQSIALREALERGDRYGAVNLRIGNPNLVWLMEGAHAEARRQCETAMREWSTVGFHLEHYYALLAQANVDLYTGDGAAAHARIEAAWGALSKSSLTYIHLIRVNAFAVRARAALACAQSLPSGERGPTLAIASTATRRLVRERAAWVTPQALLLRAGIERLAGRTAEVIPLLESAASGFDDVGMALHAAATRASLGEIKKGEKGKALVDAATSYLQDQAVSEPRRWFAIFAPGVFEG